MGENQKKMILVEKGKNLAGTIEYDYYIEKYLVTQVDYLELMGNNPSKFKGDKLAVVVNWYEAVDYCNKRSIKEGLESVYTIDKTGEIFSNIKTFEDNIKWKVEADYTKNGYRLPTEKEWEYAARGGNKTKGYKYSGSNNIENVVWYSKNSKTAGFFGLWAEQRIPHVGKKEPNELGIYDMNGNVWEWCWDLYSGGESERVIRGGSYCSAKEACEISSREQGMPFLHLRDVGFRVVLGKLS